MKLAAKERAQAFGDWSCEQMFHWLIEEATEYAVLICDRGGRIRYWNEGAVRILGYRDEEMRDKRACDIFTSEDIEHQIPQQEMRRALKEGQTIDERWHLRKDGTRFWATGVTCSMKDPSGDTVGFFKVFRNLTLRKETEERVLAEQNELAHFAYAAAHDLQEPLRNLSSGLQMLQRQHADEPRIASLIEETGRMSKLMRDILSYSEVGHGSKAFEMTECNAIFDLAVNNLRVAIHESQARVTRGVLPFLTVLPTQFERLLRNLIGNALKFRKKDEPPTVYVSAVPVRDEWVFSVRDNGIGIAEEDVPKLFGAFHKVHSREEYGGSGLGLALCKKIVESHGGKIWVESKVGEGSEFFFSLPVHPTA